MSEWRFARGWSNAELEERLAEAARLRTSFEESEQQMTAERGWHQDFSQAVIASEPPGPPLSDGAFARAWQLVASYAFSDPRIVRGHFDASSPLLGRRMLLEIRAMGLHFLGPVIVGAVRDESDERRTVRGFRYDTLQGHLERGSRWFEVRKDHATGEVIFRIRASWQRGRLPNAWSRLGFRLFARRYQHIWHRLAHLRLRTMLGWTGTEPIVFEDQLAHQGPRLATASAWAGHRGSFAPRTERGISPARLTGSVALSRVAALGAVSGSRSLLGPALVAHQLEHHQVEATADNSVARLLSRPYVAPILAGLAALELGADKTSAIPPRTDPLPYAGRLAMGAVVGAALAESERRRAAALAGAAGAGVGTLLFSGLRQQATRRLGSNLVAGICEDAVAIGLGVILVRRLRRK